MTLKTIVLVTSLSMAPVLLLGQGNPRAAASRRHGRRPRLRPSLRLGHRRGRRPAVHG